MASATNNTDGTVNYTNDSTGQLLAATGGPSYSYDANGNRTNSGYQTGPNNEFLYDGTYTYAYDANGNRTSRTAADGSQIQYGWDNRNRLISVTFKNSGGATTQTVTYIYDASNRWVGETIVAGSTTTQARYVYDGNQIVLEFDGTGSGSLTATSPSHRYLWGPAVDQLLADEQLSGTAQVVWTLGDNENTIRDLATYNGSTTTVANHRVFSAYGQLLSQTNSSVGCLFAYTGRPLDQATGLQNNLNRWYDAIVGRWLSQDPIGFNGGDANLYRYVGNSPVDGMDPAGLQPWMPPAINGPGRIGVNPTPTPTPSWIGISDWHYRRNDYNWTPSYEYAKQNWVLLSDSQSRYHRHGKGNEHNLKFVSPDGHCEAVYQQDGTPVTNETNGGTYNYQFDPYGQWYNNILHFILDMLPYYLLGNGPNDTTPFWNRVLGPDSTPTTCTPTAEPSQSDEPRGWDEFNQPGTYPMPSNRYWPFSG
jgi:RHS repeat-associated protein